MRGIRKRLPAQDRRKKKWGRGTGENPPTDFVEEKPSEI